MRSTRRSLPRVHSAVPPATATNDSPTKGWWTTPTSGRLPSFSAISVAQCSWPMMKLRVPSIGSITQVQFDEPFSQPCSSPRMP